MPGSIPDVGDPKLGAAVKIAIWQRQNLYLEHIGSDRRIFSQDPHPMSCKMSRRGPSYVPAIKICMFFDLLIMGVCGVEKSVSVLALNAVLYTSGRAQRADRSPYPTSVCSHAAVGAADLSG